MKSGSQKPPTTHFKPNLSHLQREHNRSCGCVLRAQAYEDGATGAPIIKRERDHSTLITRHDWFTLEITFMPWSRHENAPSCFYAVVLERFVMVAPIIVRSSQDFDQLASLVCLPLSP
ncbi:hypothetical protein N7G274_003627 [Stereocaulon virgatum]|uniref:Uncharacterized protein n=1 Tax=Stereocaulon virgatum TaxID=373712 RepID=A0ABR4AEN8_9LECA